MDSSNDQINENHLKDQVTSGDVSHIGSNPLDNEKKIKSQEIKPESNGLNFQIMNHSEQQNQHQMKLKIEISPSQPSSNQQIENPYFKQQKDIENLYFKQDSQVFQLIQVVASHLNRQTLIKEYNISLSTGDGDVDSSVPFAYLQQEELTKEKIKLFLKEFNEKKWDIKKTSSNIKEFLVSKLSDIFPNKRVPKNENGFIKITINLILIEQQKQEVAK